MRVLFFIAGILISGLSFAQQFKGNWEGNLEVMGQSLPIIIHIDYENESYSATMDSPKQGAKGIALDSKLNSPNELILSSTQLNLKYTLQYIDQENLDGRFMQNNMAFDLDLKPMKEEEVKIKNSIADYITREFIIDVGEHQIAGEINSPFTGEKHPLLILIAGSGPQDRTGEVLGNEIFTELTLKLIREEWAVLRFDERGLGKSTGSHESADTYDLADDVNALINYAAKSEFVDENNIILIGHSEGGLIAPIVANKNKNVKGFISIAGPSLNGDQILREQSEVIFKQSGLSEQELEKRMALINKQYDLMLAKNAQNKDSVELLLEENLRKQLSLQKLNKDQMRTYLNKGKSQLNSPWINTFIKIDVAKTIRNIKKPALYIYGEKDVQVISNSNIKALNKTLNSEQKEKVKIVELKQHNHLMQVCDSCTIEEYSALPGEFSKELIDTLKAWLILNINM